MRAFFVVVSLLALCWAPLVTAQGLPALGADPTHVSVSGLSSGGFMAVQYSIAWSSEVMGVGVVAGGPYNCGAANLSDPVGVCMHGKPSAPDSWKAIRSFARDKVIDDPANIARQRVYLFTGSKDDVVHPSVVRALLDFYALAGVPGPALRYVDTLKAGHGFVSPFLGGPCGSSAAIYVVRCKVGGSFYDQPGEILRHLYGPPPAAPRTAAGAPFAFDQQRYAGADSMMADRGYAYVPPRCRETGAHCGIHVVFHGCMQGAATIHSDAVYARLGYNRWADAYGLILVYPQIEVSAANPIGCWSWIPTLLIPDVQLRHAPQIEAVHQMVTQLLKPA